MVASAIMPYSQGMQEMSSSDNPFILLFMLVYCACICFTIYYIIKKAHSNGMMLFFYIIFVMFFVQSFMAHIETLFFGSTLFSATKLDAVLLMLSGLLPLAVVPLLIKFFQQKKDLIAENKLNYKIIPVKLVIIGIAYLCSFVLFGFLMTLIFEDFRTHYGETITNTPNGVLNASIQILRGVLYGAFIIPLLNILKSKREFIISVCLVYLCATIQLIIPNEMFTDRIRYIYLFEMTGAMLLFGIIVGNVLWRIRKNNNNG